MSGCARARPLGIEHSMSMLTYPPLVSLSNETFQSRHDPLVASRRTLPSPLARPSNRKSIRYSETLLSRLSTSRQQKSLRNSPSQAPMPVCPHYSLDLALFYDARFNAATSQSSSQIDVQHDRFTQTCFSTAASRAVLLAALAAAMAAQPSAQPDVTPRIRVVINCSMV